VKTVYRKKYLIDSYERLFENKEDFMKIGEDVFDSIDRFTGEDDLKKIKMTILKKKID
jgi:hypothetical protein